MLKAASIIGASALTQLSTVSSSSVHPLRHAKPLHRHLNNNGYPTSAHSIRFSQCIDLKLLDDDLFDEQVIEYVQNGEIVSTKSYVTFHLCYHEECYYESENDLYFVDLASFLETVGVFRANERGRYCEACEEFEGYCNSDDGGYNDDGNGAGDEDAGDDGAVEAEEEENVEQEANNENVEQAENNEAAAENNEQDNAQAAEEGNDAAEAADEQQRKLFTTNHRTLANNNNNAIDCDQCSALNCYNETYTNSDDDIADLIANLANCLPTNQYWNNEQLYISAMCTPYGDGVELAVFLDNECTVYTNKATFANVYQSYIQDNGLEDLSSYVEMYVKSGLEEDMSCEDVEYVTPEEAADYSDDDDANNNNNAEANEYCQQIFNQGAIEFNQCYNGNDDASSYGNKYNPTDDEYSWYTYDMTYDQAKDLQDVCTAVYRMEGEYTYSYDAEKSGTWYSRDKSGSIKSKNKSGGFVEFSPVAIVCLVLLGVGIVGVAALVSYRKSRARRMEPLYQGGAMI